jgi:hypothetical protein
MSEASKLRPYSGALNPTKLEPKTEAQIQRAIFTHIRQRGMPGVFAFHCPNGGWRTNNEGAILQGLGVVAGVPDVIILYKGRCYGLELKMLGKHPSAKQLEVKQQMEAAGATWAFAQGYDAALGYLERWGVVRGKIQ